MKIWMIHWTDPPAPKRAVSPVVFRLNTTRQKEVVPVPKSRRVLPEHEGKYTVKMPQGTTAKTKKILAKKKATGECSHF